MAVPELKANKTDSNVQALILSGGKTKCHRLPYSSAVHRYDMIKKCWTKLQSLKFGRKNHSMCYLASFLYVFGGYGKTEQASMTIERLYYDNSNLFRQHWQPLTISEGLIPSGDVRLCPMNKSEFLVLGGMAGDRSLNSNILVLNIDSKIARKLSANMRECCHSDVQFFYEDSQMHHINNNQVLFTLQGPSNKLWMLAYCHENEKLECLETHTNV